MGQTLRPRTPTMVTRMLSLLVLTATLGCRAAIPNPEPVKEPAAWAAEREQAARATAPGNAAKASGPNAEPAPAPAPASAPQTPPSPAPATQGGSTDKLIVARVAGEAIDVTELLKQWMHRDSYDVFQQLNRL